MHDAWYTYAMWPATVARTQRAVLEMETGASMSYGELEAAVEANVAPLQGRGLVMIPMHNTIACVVQWLAAWRAHVPAMLLDPALAPEKATDLRARYRPDVAEPASHPDLALLLATSGSTGNPKFVRLSRRAVRHNAEGIAARLALNETERPALNLPLHYAYGLSVLHSHLVVGATILLSEQSVFDDAFWAGARTYGATSLAGVPYTYQLMRRMSLDTLVPASLLTMTQAGGKLDAANITKMSTWLAGRGGRFVVMYGQTEATARLSLLDPRQLDAKLGSVGTALPGATFSIAAPAPDGNGEIIAHSPSVMMGYAETRADLARADEVGGTLATGDVGHLDNDGYLWITGRIKRIAKVYGTRINLDDIEAIISSIEDAPTVAALGHGDKLLLIVEGEPGSLPPSVPQRVCAEASLATHAVVVRYVARLPRLPSGKLDRIAIAGSIS